MITPLRVSLHQHPLIRRLDATCFVLLSLVVVTVLMRLAFARLPNPYFWWDDAGQYWMSQGQAHLFAFDTSPQSVWNGVAHGRSGSNLDPIGFTIVLRGWIDLFGTSAWSLRLLPFIFFLGSLCVGVIIGYRTFRLPLVVSLALPSLVLLTYLPFFYATELRAFTLELLAVLALATCSIAFGTSGNARYLTLAVFLGLVGTVLTRYSYIIAVAAASFTLTLVVIRNRGRHWRPQVLATLLLAAGSTLFVAWNVGFFSELRQTPPRYYTSTMDLAGSWTFGFLARAVRENLIRNGGILTSVFLITAAIAWLLMWRSRRLQTIHAPRDLPRLQPWQVASVFVLAYEVAAISVSGFGLSPWWASGRWSIGLYAIALISGFGIFGAARQLLVEARPTKGIDSSNRTSPLLLFSGAVVLLATAALLGRDLYRQAPALLGVTAHRDPFVVLVKAASEDVAEASSVTWRVPPWYWPSFRMLWETKSRAGIDAPMPRDASPLNVPLFPSDQEIASAVALETTCGRNGLELIFSPLVEGNEPQELREVLLRLADASNCQMRIVSQNSAGVVYALEPDSGFSS